MPLIGWVDSENLDTMWPESTQLELEDLDMFLSAAHTACEAYAPATPWVAQENGALVAVIPPAWQLAQVMHAKHLYARFRTGNRDSIGPDGYAISTYPLVMEARSLLRPKRPGFKGLL